MSSTMRSPGVSEREVPRRVSITGYEPWQQASWTRATSLGPERQCDVKDEGGSASDKSPVGQGDERAVDNGQEDQGGPGQTCCSRRGARGCRSKEGLVVLLLLLVVIFVFCIKRFIFNILKRRFPFLVLPVHLILLILAWLWRRTSSGSNVLWSELPNQQRPALLQRQHHLRP